MKVGFRIGVEQKPSPHVPCRWDDRCCETEEWQRRAGVSGLRRGPEQPFYHVLVDQRDWAKGTATPDAMLAYVAEEMLTAPEVRVQTWLSDGTFASVAFMQELVAGAEC